jgi:hypothetical protein
MSLPGQQLELLHTAVCDSFNEVQLVMWLRFKLGIELGHITTGPLNYRVFQLLRLLDNEGTLDEFVRQLAQARPANPLVVAYVQQYAPEVKIEPPTSPSPPNVWDVETGDEQTERPQTKSVHARRNRSAWIQTLVYLAVASATGYGLWRLLGQKDTFGPTNWQFWFALAVILLLVLVSLFAHSLPAWWERRQKERLRRESGKVTSNQPRYFRLTPYGETEADQKAFKREDQTHADVLTWVREATLSLLYLTGVSGSGKSSVLAAYVIPKLRGETLVVPLRASDAPLGYLRAALLTADAVWTAKQAAEHWNDRDADLLRNAAEELAQKNRKLLVVVDQFEELLTLHASDSIRTTPVLNLLRSVSAGQCGATTALACLRIEFIDELTRVGLPAPVYGRNHFTVAAFQDAAARKFLSSGFDRLDQERLDQVIAEAAALDQLNGLIRPITLNMAGQMLQRLPTVPQHGTVSARPFADYVCRMLKENDIRDQAVEILGQLIDNRNRRVHKSVRELAGPSGDIHLINGCLTRLASPERGLTRCLNSGDPDIGSWRWEVSHDFVAAVLGAALPTLRPSVWKSSAVAGPDSPCCLASHLRLFSPLRVSTRSRTATRGDNCSTEHRVRHSDYQGRRWVAVDSASPQPPTAVIL